MEEQGRGESSVVGSGGAQHAERDVTDAMPALMPRGNNAPTRRIPRGIAMPQAELVQRLPQYKMNHPQRGRCLVFNNESFHRTTKMEPRHGSKADADNLEAAFTGLGFSVQVLTDMGTTDIKEILYEAAQYDHSQSDCFVCVFLSHGKNGMIYGYNGLLEIKELTDMFRGHNCPTLKGKPKLFFFQACRGTDHERAVEPSVTTDGSGGAGEEEPMDVMDAGVRPTLPAGADFLMAYSVSEGFYAYRNTVMGSWYIQELCKALREHGTNMEICEILTLVNLRVSQRAVEGSEDRMALGAKQMPCFLSMLTKRLFFTEGHQVHTSHFSV
ncbi:caspase-6-like [Branchiostoma floridae x Branchiostoma belcheri]